MDPQQNLNKIIDELIKRIRDNMSIDLGLVKKALEFGMHAHAGQYRKKGDLYFIHPLRVALKAIDYNLDTNTVISSLLHDVVEDTNETIESIENNFGKTVSLLVGALTKVKENKKLTLYKIFELGNVDFRVILIKLLDRLDNLSDLQFLSRTKQRAICQETATIYTEVAHGLGLIDIEEEMRDLIFQRLYPSSYHKTSQKLNQFYKGREAAIQQIVKTVQNTIPTNLYHRVLTQYIKPHQFLYDRQDIQKVLESLIIETENPIDCYIVLGEIHTHFRSIPLNIRDYISNPKANGWRGLSTKVIVYGEQVDIFIVTRKFQKNNRRGVITLINEGVYQSENYQQFLQLYLDVASSKTERIEDVFRYNKSRIVQVSTPVGDIIELRYGATILDFAFSVHSEIGNHCTGGIIEQIRYPNNKILEDGMVIEVITSETVTPSLKWLEHVVMPKSRKEILKFSSKHLQH
ncbi:MAG: HD domain-containing protein [Proteobacteria bacterium]|nr:HD domain-containing protein [Pseudomonadota bacterium]